MKLGPHCNFWRPTRDVLFDGDMSMSGIGHTQIDYYSCLHVQESSEPRAKAPEHSEAAFRISKISSPSRQKQLK